MGTVDVVVGVALVSLFYGIMVSLVVPYFPGAAGSQLAFFTDGHGVSQIATMQQGLQTGLQSQSSIPFLDFGSLIFYSSVTALNLFINVLTAVPQMMGVLVNGLLILLHVPIGISAIIQIGVLGLFTVLFYFALFIYIISSRSPTYGGIK